MPPSLPDDLARTRRVQELPDEEMRADLAAPLLVVGRVRALDEEVALAGRAHGEARPHVVAA
jgi:hypothetical protein